MSLYQHDKFLNAQKEEDSPRICHYGPLQEKPPGEIKVSVPDSLTIPIHSLFSG